MADITATVLDRRDSTRGREAVLSRVVGDLADGETCAYVVTLGRGPFDDEATERRFGEWELEDARRYLDEVSL